MPKSNYLKIYAESFAIFAKYEPSTTLDFDIGSIGVHMVEAVSKEDDARLKELGWEVEGIGYYYRNERFQRLSDFD